MHIWSRFETCWIATIPKKDLAFFLYHDSCTYQILLLHLEWSVYQVFLGKSEELICCIESLCEFETMFVTNAYLFSCFQNFCILSFHLCKYISLLFIGVLIVISVRGFLTNLMKVAELIGFQRCMHSCLEYLEVVPWVGDEEEEKVPCTNFMFSREGCDDNLIWHYEKIRILLVKSAYRLAASLDKRGF
ncbi:hypothetical protein Scep_030075 [Stephania cephalantha]|uniref:Uncharacterized protein n=1 Tax=Stephania cephalantha TaxID=152367 RepID=A0AAP0E6L8_9MAGN